ncbi:MAG: hypothetical protein ACRDRL_05170 [Sciscionella sp.]
MTGTRGTRPVRSRAHNATTPEAAQVQAYIEGIAAEHRPLFDRLQRLVLQVRPDAALDMSYGMLAYRVGARRRLYIGAWKHGLSLYGWPQGCEAAIIARHPELKTSKGTLRLSPATAAQLTDAELRGLVQAVRDD